MTAREMEMSIKTERENTQKVYKMERVTGSERVRKIVIMLIAIVRTFSVGLCGAFDLEQRYTVNIHTVNSVGGESQKISGGWFAIQLKLELGAKKKIELV